MRTERKILYPTDVMSSQVRSVTRLRQKNRVEQARNSHLAPPYMSTRTKRNGTTVEVKEETWKELHSRKGIGDSFDDVIRRLLEGER